MGKVFKFGILGCGMIANFHAEAIKLIDEAELIAVSDNKKEYAENFAAKHGIKACNSYEEMLSEVDVVCICTPSGFHAENAIQALRAGCHVVLEKPMALNTKDADMIIETSKESGALITVISQLRFAEDLQKVKKLVSENAFGKIAFCDLYMKYYRNEDYFKSSPWKGTLKFDGGGALLNQGIHGVDLLQFMVGEPKVISGKIKTLSHDVEVEDTAVAMLEFENGALGVIEGSTCSYPGFDRRYEIMGDKGYVIVVEDKIREIMLNGEKTVFEEVQKDESSSSNPAAIDCSLHIKQITNLINAINGKEPLLIDAHEGRKAIRIIEDIYNFSKTLN